MRTVVLGRILVATGRTGALLVVRANLPRTAAAGESELLVSLGDPGLLVGFGEDEKGD